MTLPPAATSDFGLGDEEEGAEETRRVVTEAELAAALEQAPKDKNFLRALLGSRGTPSWGERGAPSATTSSRRQGRVPRGEERSGDESSSVLEDGKWAVSERDEQAGGDMRAGEAGEAGGAQAKKTVRQIEEEAALAIFPTAAHVQVGAWLRVWRRLRVGGLGVVGCGWV